MPTPGGLLKAGDKLIRDGVMYIVVERDGNSAPYSVWIRREPGFGPARITRIGGRSVSKQDLRESGTEYRIMLETGRLPGGWILWDPNRNAQPPRPKAIRPKMPEPPPRLPKLRTMRKIRVRECQRPNPSEGEQVEFSISWNDAQATVAVISELEAMDLAIRLITYLRDKAEGIL